MPRQSIGDQFIQDEVPLASGDIPDYCLRYFPILQGRLIPNSACVDDSEFPPCGKSLTGNRRSSDFSPQNVRNAFTASASSAEGPMSTDRCTCATSTHMPTRTSRLLTADTPVFRSTGWTLRRCTCTWVARVPAAWRTMSSMFRSDDLDVLARFINCTRAHVSSSRRSCAAHLQGASSAVLSRLS